MSKPTTRAFSRQYAYGDVLWIIHNRGNADLWCSCKVCAKNKTSDERRSPNCPDFAAKGTFAIYHPGFGWRDDECVRGSVSTAFQQAKAKMEKRWRTSMRKQIKHLREQTIRVQNKLHRLKWDGAQAFAYPASR